MLCYCYYPSYVHYCMVLTAIPEVSFDAEYIFLEQVVRFFARKSTRFHCVLYTEIAPINKSFCSVELSKTGLYIHLHTSFPGNEECIRSGSHFRCRCRCLRADRASPRSGRRLRMSTERLENVSYHICNTIYSKTGCLKQYIYKIEARPLIV